MSAGQLRYEVATSRRRLHRLLGVPANFFCYPAGRFDQAVIDEVRRAGYRGATTTELGFARPSDTYTLARVRVNRSEASTACCATCARWGRIPTPRPLTAEGGVRITGREPTYPRHVRALVAGASLTVLAVAGIVAWIAVSSWSGRDHSVARPIPRPARAESVANPPTATPAPTRVSDPLAGKIVAVDPGHNGGNASHPAEINRLVDIGNGRKACDTTGAATADGYTEAAYNLDVALRLRRLLEAMGARAVMTRTTNTGVGPCINKRAEVGNRAHANAAISIHADGGPRSGRGFHVIYPAVIRGLTDDIAAASKRLAVDVRAAYQRGTHMPRADYIGTDGLDERSDLGGFNLSNVPKVFIETGNMANPADAAHLERPAFRQRAAAGIAAGIERFLTR